MVLADEPTGNLDTAATLDVLRLFDDLHTAGQTLVIVTHDPRVAATADRLVTMRDGAFVDETRLTPGTPGRMRALRTGVLIPMGRTLLVLRLAVRDLRRRPSEAALLLLAITAATTTLTLGLVHGVIDTPYEPTRNATAGPDVVATLFARAGGAPTPRDVVALTEGPGVVAHSGPFPDHRRCSRRTAAPCWLHPGPRHQRPRRSIGPRRPGRWLRDRSVVVEGRPRSRARRPPG